MSYMFLMFTGSVFTSGSYLKSKALRHALPGAFHCLNETFLQLQEVLEAFFTCLLIRYGQIVGRVLDQERAVEVPLDGMSADLLLTFREEHFDAFPCNMVILAGLIGPGLDLQDGYTKEFCFPFQDGDEGSRGPVI